MLFLEFTTTSTRFPSFRVSSYFPWLMLNVLSVSKNNSDKAPMEPFGKEI